MHAKPQANAGFKTKYNTKFQAVSGQFICLSLMVDFILFQVNECINKRELDREIKIWKKRLSD